MTTDEHVMETMDGMCKDIRNYISFVNDKLDQLEFYIGTLGEDNDGQ